MNIPFCKPTLTLSLVFFASLLPSHAQTPAVRVTAEAPEALVVFSPEFNVGGKKGYQSKEWIELEGRIKVQMAPAPKSKICDQLQVKWYVAVENPERPDSMLMFTQEVEHVNVPLDEDIYCSVYLSPSSIHRIRGEIRKIDKLVKYLGYEVFINGVKVAEQSTRNAKVGWWNVASPKLARAENVKLLKKPETPFAALWWDRYAEVGETRK